MFQMPWTLFYNIGAHLLVVHSALVLIQLRLNNHLYHELECIIQLNRSIQSIQAV